MRAIPGGSIRRNFASLPRAADRRWELLCQSGVKRTSYRAWVERPTGVPRSRGPSRVTLDPRGIGPPPNLRLRRLWADRQPERACLTPPRRSDSPPAPDIPALARRAARTTSIASRAEGRRPCPDRATDDARARRRPANCEGPRSGHPASGRGLGGRDRPGKAGSVESEPSSAPESIGGWRRRWAVEGYRASTAACDVSTIRGRRVWCGSRPRPPRSVAAPDTARGPACSDSASIHRPTTRRASSP